MARKLKANHELRIKKFKFNLFSFDSCCLMFFFLVHFVIFLVFHFIYLVLMSPCIVIIIFFNELYVRETQ